MAEPDSNSSRPVTLSLSRRDQWLLHHVLLDRIEQHPRTENPTVVDSAPIEVCEAFEILDSGESSFTVSQLEAMRSVLSEYHHSTTWWELERQRIEMLLHRITEGIEAHQESVTADGA